MGKYSLEPRPALDGASLDYEGLTIREMPQVQLLSVATPSEKISDVSKALKSRCGVSWPNVGQSTTSADISCLGLQDTQVFLLHTLTDQEHTNLAQDLSKTALITDQSDSWVCVSVNGECAINALERVCPIDLHPEVFTNGSVARTAMEHLSVLVFRQGNDFLLLSPRSSADSFLHTLKQSADFAL